MGRPDRDKGAGIVMTANDAGASLFSKTIYSLMRCRHSNAVSLLAAHSGCCRSNFGPKSFTETTPWSEMNKAPKAALFHSIVLPEKAKLSASFQQGPLSSRLP